jgi:hypothetical protein
MTGGGCDASLLALSEPDTTDKIRPEKKMPGKAGHLNL